MNQHTMALTNCRECGTEVSTHESACLKCGADLDRSRPASFGGIHKWVFIGYNLLMLVWLVAIVNTAVDGTVRRDTQNAGAVMSPEFGAVLIVFIWVSGAFLLALFNWFTNSRR